jgi:hypothetical protein
VSYTSRQTPATVRTLPQPGTAPAPLKPLSCCVPSGQGCGEYGGVGGGGDKSLSGVDGLDSVCGWDTTQNRGKAVE